jgi:hypothetical protein
MLQLIVSMLQLRRDTTRDLEELPARRGGTIARRPSQDASSGIFRAGLFERVAERAGERAGVLSPGPISGSTSSRRCSSANPYDPASFAMSRQATQRLSTPARIGMPASPASSTSPGSPTVPSATPSRNVAKLRRSADGVSPVAAGSARELRAQSRTISRGERRSRTVRFLTESREPAAARPLSPTKTVKSGRVKL